MKMGIKTRTLAAVGIGCLALGAGAGLAGIYGYRNNEREGRISEILSGFKDRCRLVGSEPACFFERASRPGKLLTRKSRVSHADVQLDGMRVQRQTLAESLYGVVVMSFVVKLMRTFVVFVGTEERIRHRTGPSRMVAL